MYCFFHLHRFYKIWSTSSHFPFPSIHRFSLSVIWNSLLVLPSLKCTTRSRGGSRFLDLLRNISTTRLIVRMYFASPWNRNSLGDPPLIFEFPAGVPIGLSSCGGLRFTNSVSGNSLRIFCISVTGKRIMIAILIHPNELGILHKLQLSGHVRRKKMNYKRNLLFSTTTLEGRMLIQTPKAKPRVNP